MKGIPYVPIFESLPAGLPISGKEVSGTPELLKVASSILEREAIGLPSASPARAVPTQALPAAGEVDRLSQRAHELLAGLFAAFGHPQGGAGYGSGQPAPVASAASQYESATRYAGRTCPVTHAAVPMGGFDPDNLRRQLHEVIKTLLTAFKDSTDDQALPDHPTSLRHLPFPVPVRAGSKALRSITIANEEHTPSEVTLYSTNFVADTGYDIPAVQVSVSPRRQTIPAGGRANFEIEIQIPQQAPAGIYSGLIQAMATKYVKAVLSVEVQ